MPLEQLSKYAWRYMSNGMITTRPPVNGKEVLDQFNKAHRDEIPNMFYRKKRVEFFKSSTHFIVNIGYNSYILSLWDNPELKPLYGI